MFPLISSAVVTNLLCKTFFPYNWSLPSFIFSSQVFSSITQLSITFEFLSVALPFKLYVSMLRQSLTLVSFFLLLFLLKYNLSSFPVEWNVQEIVKVFSFFDLGFIILLCSTVSLQPGPYLTFAIHES